MSTALTLLAIASGMLASIALAYGDVTLAVAAILGVILSTASNQ